MSNRFEKLPPWYGDIVVTEKIDGMAGAIYVRMLGLVTEDEPKPVSGNGIVVEVSLGEDDEDAYFEVRALTKRGAVVPGDKDPFEFAKWVHDNAELLAAVLPDGLHYGVWWGRGIDRGYDDAPRTFSLFDASKFYDRDGGFILDGTVDGLALVPVLYFGPLVPTNGTDPISEAKRRLVYAGSLAKPGFREPEGVVVTHAPSGYAFESRID